MKPKTNLTKQFDLFRVTIVMVLSLYCVIAGCNCSCGSERSCMMPEDSDSLSIESTVTVGFLSETLVR